MGREESVSRIPDKGSDTAPDGAEEERNGAEAPGDVPSHGPDAGALTGDRLTGGMLSGDAGDFPFHRIFHLASRLHAQGDRFIARELERAGLAGVVPSHGDILHQLFTNDDCKMSDLARRIHRSRSTSTVLVAKLEKHGYVRRVPDADDQRGVRVRLTEKGRALGPAVMAISRDLENLLASRLSQEELDTLERLLERCVGPEDGTEG